MRAFAFASAISLALAGAAEAAPRRVASLNLCTDELLLDARAPGADRLGHPSRPAAGGDAAVAAGAALPAQRRQPGLGRRASARSGADHGRRRPRPGADRRAARDRDARPALSAERSRDIEASVRKVAAALGRPQAARADPGADARAEARAVPRGATTRSGSAAAGAASPPTGLAAQWMALAGFRQRAARRATGCRSSNCLSARRRCCCAASIAAANIRASRDGSPIRWRGASDALAEHRHRRAAVDLHGSAPDRRDRAAAAARRRDEPARRRLALLGHGLLAAGSFAPVAGRSLGADRRVARAGPARSASPCCRELRLPRAALALAYGAMLGASGAAIQGLFANPLASPDLTGTTSGAALGAVVTAYLFGFSAPLALASGAVGGALGALLLLLALAGPRAETATLLLAGLAISALAGALTTLALALAPSPFAFYDAYEWLMGSLVDRSLDQAAFAAAPALLAIALLLRLRAPARQPHPRRGGRAVVRPRRPPPPARDRLPYRFRSRRLRRHLRSDRLRRPGRADLRPPPDRRTSRPGRSLRRR